MLQQHDDGLRRISGGRKVSLNGLLVDADPLVTRDVRLLDSGQPLGADSGGLARPAQAATLPAASHDHGGIETATVLSLRVGARERRAPEAWF